MAGVAQRLSPEDLSILALETESVAGHTCKVIVLEDRINLDLLRAAISSRLRRAPKLWLRLSDIDLDPTWVTDQGFDVREHVVLCDLPNPPDEEALRATVARLFEQRLDRSKPLWRIDVIPELADGGSALIWRIHHALADGATAMRMARAALWDEGLVGAEVLEEEPRGRTRADSVQDHRLRALRTVAREAPKPWLRSPFTGHVGARRGVAFATVELDGLRRVAASVDGATVNDAVLAVVAGGLQRWLESHHGRLGAVRVKVPVSLHGPSPPSGSGEAAAAPGNRDSFFCLDLPLGLTDPLRRLGAIRRATRIRKESHDAGQIDALMRQLEHVPGLRHFAERVLTHPRSFALNVSNVPGPRQPIRVLGVPVRALYSLAEIREHHALRIAVVSLRDTLNFGLVADPTLLEDVEVLARQIEVETVDLVGRLVEV